MNAPDRNVPFTPTDPAAFTIAACAGRAESPASPGDSRGCAPRRAVGGEADADTEVDELVDDGRVLPLVEVVHQLSALVTDKSVVLEPPRSLHGTVR